MTEGARHDKEHAVSTAQAPSVSRLAGTLRVPPPKWHFHQSCQHWCHGYGCRATESCTACARAQFNREHAR